MEINQKLMIFKRVAATLNQKNVNWVLGASLLLYFNELVEDFNDVDLLIDLKDLKKVERIFDEFGIQKPTTPNKHFKSDFFMTYIIDGMEFDLIGGFCIVKDNIEHYFPEIKVERYYELDGLDIPLDNLGRWCRYYDLMNRPAKVAIIKKALNEDLNLYLHSKSKPNIVAYNHKVVPNVAVSKFIGIDIPTLHRIAKKIAKQDYEIFKIINDHETFESVLLEGLVISYLKMPFKDKRPLIEDYLPLIDNWETCDTFVTSLKFKDEEMKDVYDFVLVQLNTQAAYTVRFGLVMLINNFVKDPYYAEIFDVLNKFHHDDHYVKMAVAWLLSIMYINNRELTIAYLKNNQLEAEVHNKAIQKICESLRVVKSEKSMLKQFRK